MGHVTGVYPQPSAGMALYSLNRLGLYEALCGSAQGFIQDVVFRVLSARTKYNTKMTARARSLYTVPTGWDCMKGARARSVYTVP